MNKSLAIAVSLCLVALSVSDVEAGIFGRRSGGCRGGNCYRYSAPSYPVYNQPVTVKRQVVSQPSATVPSEAKAPAAKPVSQPSNGNAIQSPSDLPVAQPAPASRVIYSSPCANGNCYSGSTYYYGNRGWYRR